MKLFMVLIGCRPPGRLTEQHDIFFGIGQSLGDLVAEMKASWPEAKGKIHIDAWREITEVDGHAIRVQKAGEPQAETSHHLFFINLGGYLPGQFEEQHCKVLAVAPNMAEATKKAKQTPFYKHNGFANATAHVDDKYGVDIDDIYMVRDILRPHYKEYYHLHIAPNEAGAAADTLYIGYVKISDLAPAAS